MYIEIRVQLKNKLDEIKLRIHDTHADISTIQETKLTPKVKTPKVHNFTTVRNDIKASRQKVLLSTHCLDPCLWGGGVRVSCLWSTSQLIPPSGQQLHHSSGICPQIHGWQCGAYVGEVEEMVCVVCMGVTEGA